MSTVRDNIRSKILGEKLNTQMVTLDDGVQIEVRQTTVGQMLDAVKEEDLRRRMIRLLIDSCFVPASNDKVFEEADFDVLVSLPAGGYYQKLMDAVNSKSFPVAVEDAKKP